MKPQLCMFFLSLLWLTSACSKTEDEQIEKPLQSLTLVQRSFTLPETEGTLDVEIKYSGSYNAKILSDAEWIKEVTDHTTSANMNVHHYKFEANETYDGREAKIVFVNKENISITDTASIYQMYKGAIIVARNEYEFASEGGVLDFTVQSNLTIDVSIEGDWIKQTSTRALVDYPLHFNIGINDTKDKRIGKITIKDKASNKQQIVTITQIGQDDIIERKALIALYKSTGGDNWINKENWCTDKPLNEWYGIESVEDHVAYINLGDNNLNGKIPVEIGNLIYLKTLIIYGNHCTGILPDEVESLKNLEHLNLRMNEFSIQSFDVISKMTNLKNLYFSQNQLSGDLPASIGNLTNLMELDLSRNEFTGIVPNEIWQLSNLQDLNLGFNQLSGEISPLVGNMNKLISFNLMFNMLNGTLPEEICQLTKLESLSVASNKLEGEIPANIGNLLQMKELFLYNNNMTGSLPKSMSDLSHLKICNIANNKLAGTIPDEILHSEWWNSVGHKDILIQQEGYGFEAEYTSTDYSQDGKISLLNQATKGKGINIVLLGNGFTDKEIASGTYDKIMKRTMECFFSEEPFKSFKDYFNVYSLKAVSPNSGMSFETALKDKAKLREYVEKIPGIIFEEVLAIIIMNDMYSGGYTGHWDNGFSDITVPLCGGVDKDVFKGVICHEIGHGFGRLADEYLVSDEILTIPQEEINIMKEKQKQGWYGNIAFTNDLEQISWHSFIEDNRYDGEELGAYEGAIYKFGVFRPTKNSIMNGGNNGGYNAPSRLSIYKRIMELSGEAYSYDKFIEYDSINRHF